ncbi:uncharacterized protein LAESUDRAFT_812674 [Laetiporus sulphureus 93-53]|uniref:DUF6534 domain-containing protein n=1 Tax=Laetiporus sulphureus 93-53 TaxID=1314785 RepID=A0A165ECG0_9APHY|nr:uncharacterized protein LAESUDRAFT_812674 [Laetiporus sulphureus 93-53]KZT06725.1 hypothetical protein LAESUDRAFT_812674 [Laetiporus sulphureus 93-53]
MGEYSGNIGSTLVTVFLSAILVGMANVQVVIYFMWYPRDPLSAKVGVVWLWLLDVLHLLFCFDIAYIYNITDFANPFGLLTVSWSVKAQGLIEMALIVSVHALYIERIWRLSDKVHRDGPYKRVLPVFLSVILAGVAGGSIVVLYRVFNKDAATPDLINDVFVNYFPLGASMVLDTLVAASLCYLLLRCRTAYKGTNSRVIAMVFFTVNSGMLTWLFSLITIILKITLPKSYDNSVLLMLTKLYVNMYMAMMNARSVLRKSHVNVQDTIVLSDLRNPQDHSSDEYKGVTESTRQAIHIPHASSRLETVSEQNEGLRDLNEYKASAPIRDNMLDV